MALRWGRRAALVAGAAALCTVAAFVALDRRYPFPLARLALPASGVVLAADGTPLGRRVAPDGQWRRPAPLGELGAWLPRATVAIEDRRFREHHGVDVRAFARAALANARAGRVVQGGSTLSMQLVGLTFDTPRTLRGKLVEVFRALQLERALTKDEVLERYLAAAPYGRNLSGAHAAAAHWFDKAPRDLALEEAALLAGLPQGPARLRPDRHPAAACARRNAVLDAMLAAGDIDAVAHARARAAPIELARQRLAPEGLGFHAAAAAFLERPGGAMTSLDPALQREVERVVRAHAAALPPGTDIALVAIDVAEACVVAYVGSADPRDPLDGQVDGARARRSPGSTLKPFVYAAAFERGALTPDAMVLDTPVDLAGWRPANFDGGFDGPVPVGDALRRSLNLPALRVAAAVGVERCVGIIEACGIDLAPDAISHAGLTLVTGGTPVTLLALVDGYATLARGGEHVPARRYVDEPRGAPVRVLTRATCDAVTRILSSEARAPRVRRGASHVDAPPFSWKTGTSAGHADAWAVGYDAATAVGVWVGRFDGAGHPSYVGAEVAEPILAELFVSEALAARRR